MMPTQRSVIARLRYRSLDGGWSEVSLCRATKLRRFPKNAAMDRKIFTDAKRKISSACTPLISSAEQDSSTTVFWISSSVKFVSAIFLWGAMTRELKRGVLKKFLSGRLHPEVQPVTLLYTIFYENGNPFVYLLLANGAPFTYLVYNFTSTFNCCKSKVF